MATSVNVISIKKIGAVYNQIFTPKVLYFIMPLIILFSSVEFITYMAILSKNNFNLKSVVISQDYLFFLKPWLLVHFVITFALNTASLSSLYFRAENKSFKNIFLVQYVNKFQIRVVDLIVSMIFMIVSIIFKGIQFATGFFPIDVFVDTFLLVWLLYIHLSQLSFTNGIGDSGQGEKNSSARDKSGNGGMARIGSV